MNYENVITATECERLITNAELLGVDTKNTNRISEWVGFRPSRSTVRLESDESICDLKLVHNYGHGGSGWTIFVGAAKNAVRLLSY